MSKPEKLAIYNLVHQIRDGADEPDEKRGGPMKNELFNELLKSMQEMDMSRQGLQKALSSRGNPRLDNINAIIRALGYRLTPVRI